jgi:phage terminase Nu1 subunit (DNA packaging protein)
MSRSQSKKISRSEFAQLKGVKLKTIKSYVEKGLLKTDVHLRLDLDKANKAWETIKHKEQKELSPEAEEKTLSLIEAQTQERNLKVELLKLQLAERRGELVNARETESNFFTVCRKIRDQLLELPRNVSPRLVAISDMTEISKVLNCEIERILKLLSQR